MQQTEPSATPSATGRRRAVAHVFLLATANSGAAEILKALGSTAQFGCVHDDYSFAPGIASILGHYRTPPLPGIHRLVRFSQLVTAARQLSDSLADSVLLFAEPRGEASQRLRVHYSAGNILSYPVLRLLYPDAVYVHVVRNPVLLVGRGVGLGAAARASREWRVEQRLLLGSPPAASRIQARFEDILADPVTWASRLGTICGADLRDAELQRFASVLRSQAGTPAPEGLLNRMVAWAFAVSCDAELAALGYHDSIGCPGVCRRTVAAAILRSCELTCRKGRQ